MAINISGTVFSDEGFNALLAGVTLNVSVNGAASAGNTVSSVTDGTYTISGVTAASGAVMTVYIQDGVNTQKAVTVTKSTGSNMTSVDLYQGYLNIRSDGGILTGTNMNTADANGATGISAIFAASSNTTFTVANGKNLLVMSGQSLALGISSGFTLSGGNLVIRGTLTTGSGAAFSIKGNWTNSGTFTATNSTVTFTGTGAQTITSGGSSFAFVTLNGSGGTYTLQDACVLSSSLTLTAGTLDVSASNFALTVGVNWLVTSGTFTARNGTVTFNRATNPQTVNGASGAFYNLTHSGSGSLQLATSDLTVTNNLTNSAGTLDAGTNGLDISVGGNWSNSATFTQGTRTVTLNGSGNQTLGGSTTFYNLIATGGDRSIIFTDGTTQTVTNALALTGTAGHLLTLAGTSTGGWTLAVPATQTLSYLSVSYGTATGNTAAAGSTSTDGGHNTNWTFGVTTPGTPCLQSGIFNSRIIGGGVVV